MDEYLDCDGARLRYRAAGRGPPVVLVHGWTLDLEMWDAQAAALQDAFHVIRYDRRGFGLSSGQPSAERDVADLQAVCTRLAGGRAALVGMSQGVRPVLRLAATAPERVACLVLDGPPDVDAALEDVALPRYGALARSRGLAAFRREWSAHPLMRLRNPDPAVHRKLRAMLDRYPGRDLLQPASDPGTASPALPLESIRVPALVITGEYDLPGRLQAADQLAARLPRAERAHIAAAGHLANIDNPAQYNQLLGDFLGHHCAGSNPIGERLP